MGTKSVLAVCSSNTDGMKDLEDKAAGEKAPGVRRITTLRRRCFAGVKAVVKLSFPWPSHKEKNVIVPVFLPFAGCPARCIYCAQNLQTAQGALPLDRILAGAEDMLFKRKKTGRGACELAFYGGTFTAQREEAFAKCLEAAKRWLAQGLIDRWRCSTRPDVLDSDRLCRMQDAGCTCIELGIQSFADDVLQVSGRGYEAGTAEEGMQRVLDAGFALGVQLLPGLPLSTAEGFISDVARSLQLGCSLLRFYPCLVVRSTKLAEMYERGEYVPWSVAQSVEALAQGLLLANEARVPVTRIGVAYEQDFEQCVLAGPRDPDLGTKVRSTALLLALQRMVPKKAEGLKVLLPARSQGYAFGQKGDGRRKLAELGIGPGNLFWHDEEKVAVEYE